LCSVRETLRYPKGKLYTFMKLKYVGACKDYSGYGEAARHDLGALVAANVQVTAKIPVYTPEHSDFGNLGQLATQLENNPIAYRFLMLHVTPNVYPSFLEAEKYHIGRVFWETDKLPLDFATPCQLLDEIWTGSEYNAEAIRKAGVTKPIHIVTEAIDTNIDVAAMQPYITQNKDDYKFYSMFEWTNRKNPQALLEAYWREFENTSNVSLTIKTYVDNFRPDKMKEIERDINLLKKSIGLKKYPPLYLYTSIMDRHQVYRFHKSFDCFVSAHRGEGWGIPQMEALLMENPIISTNVGGIHEYLTDKKDALLLNKYKMVTVDNSRNKQWYTKDQHWAQVDVDELREAMRWVFKNKKKAKQLGINGAKLVREKFSLEAVGQAMRKRLQEIEDTILYPIPQRRADA
jgi:glycosyltransferase involved in cell wall biosynthesis